EVGDAGVGPAELVGAGGGHAAQETDPLAEALRNGPGVKAARRRALIQALHGRPQQPRDERGRFAGGFDGGARRSVPAQSPEQAHDRLVVEMAMVSKTFGRRLSIVQYGGVCATL